jgi:hypothetical protein
MRIRKRIMVFSILSILPLCSGNEESSVNISSAKSIDWEIPPHEITDVDTELLGWINISEFPLVFSYNLESWLFLTEEPENLGDGTWLYVFKPWE